MLGGVRTQARRRCSSSSILTVWNRVRLLILAGYIWVKSRVHADTRMKARSWLFDHPRLARLVALGDPRTRVNLVHPGTGMVMDGFHRSANTYAVNSFLMANPTVRVSAHLHSPLALYDARRLGRPMILLVRDPRECIPSFLQMEPRVTPACAIDMYIRHYSATLEHLEYAVVADFPETTGNFAEIIRRCNAKFGSRFSMPERDEHFERRVTDHISELWSGLSAVPLPSSQRLSAEEVVATFDDEAMAALERARQIYEKVRSHQASRA